MRTADAATVSCLLRHDHNDAMPQFIADAWIVSIIIAIAAAAYLDEPVLNLFARVNTPRGRWTAVLAATSLSVLLGLRWLLGDEFISGQVMNWAFLAALLCADACLGIRLHQAMRWPTEGRRLPVGIDNLDLRR